MNALNAGTASQQKTTVRNTFLLGKFHVSLMQSITLRLSRMRRIINLSNLILEIYSL